MTCALPKLLYKDEVLLVVPCRIEIHKVIAFGHLRFVTQSREQVETLVTVFVIPELGVNDRRIVFQQFDAAFQNERLEILYIHLDAFQRRRLQFGDMIKHAQLRLNTKSFVPLGDAFMHDMTQSLLFRAAFHRHHHFHFPVMITECAVENGNIGQVEFSDDAVKCAQVIRHRLERIHFTLRKMLREVNRHDPDVGADIQHHRIRREQAQEMEEIFFLAVVFERLHLVPRKHEEVIVEAEQLLQDGFDCIFHFGEGSNCTVFQITVGYIDVLIFDVLMLCAIAQIFRFALNGISLR